MGDERPRAEFTKPGRLIAVTFLVYLALATVGVLFALAWRYFT